MAVLKENFLELIQELESKRVVLVAVSKTKPVEDIQTLYDLGHLDFGENYVQELVEKQAKLPVNIRWHFIGHLQSNKVKFIAPFVELIHGIDSFKLLKEINKQGTKNNRILNCLLQIHIATEETKFGLDENELHALLQQFTKNEEMKYTRICGLMGMASFTENREQVRKEFKMLKSLFDRVKEKYFYHEDHFKVLSMGMSADYQIAVEEGSNMVRVGSLLFGERN